MHSAPEARHDPARWNMIRTGVAGWDYPDWSGIVYPPHPARDFDRLAWLAEYFDTVEINVTFYRQPDPDACRSWAARVAGNPRFRFTAKLFHALTHAGRIPGRAVEPGNVDLAQDAARYREGIEPLRTAGLLGAVLLQFPQSFHDRPENRAHLERLHGLLPGLTLVAEVRHRSWNHDEALRFLAGLGLGFCNVDQPRLTGTLGPTGHVTAPTAYIRLHGRNAEHWFPPRPSPGDPPAARTGARRYDYLYTMQELEPWVERAVRIADRAEEVFIVANNHYRGKAPVNALMIQASIARHKVAAPPDLVAAYPKLGGWTEPRPPARTPRLPGASRQGELF
jgi:uncharacterized protein YecE (DUF72 family)